MCVCSHYLHLPSHLVLRYRSVDSNLNLKTRVTTHTTDSIILYTRAVLCAMENYQYSPLPGEDYIRLALIHPGKYQDEIVVSLHASPFRGGLTPDYEALSYVWGSEQDPEPIRIDPEPFYPRSHGRAILHSIKDQADALRHMRRPDRARLRALLLGRKNLVAAMRHLRHKHNPRVVWVDALCINQKDDAEKGPQVSMMGEIYRLATRVVAWLGPERDNSNRAMEMMEYIGSQVEVDFKTQSMQPVNGCTDPYMADLSYLLPLSIEDLQAIYHLLNRQWYERLWIRQEIYLANPQAAVLCGFREVKWIFFRHGLFLMSRKLKPMFEQLQALLHRLRYLRGFTFQRMPVVLWDLRKQFGSCQCSDPRDWIYGVISLLDAKGKSLVPFPDYQKPHSQVYTEIALKYCQYYDNVNILRSCEIQKDPIVPSWVPDWSKPRDRLFPDSNSYASGPFKSIIDLTQDGILGLVGISKAVVEAYQATTELSDLPFTVCIDEIRTLLFGHDMAGEYATGTSRVEAWARNLICDMTDNVEDPPSEIWPSLSGAKRIFEKILSGHQFKYEDFAVGSDEYKFMLTLSQTINNRCIIKCTDGYIGISSPLVEAGDMICVLLGCTHPMLLRPVEDGKFVLVGECFVPGLTQGEALLGPLPQHVRHSYIYSKEQDDYHHGFVDTISGTKFYFDPRLESPQPKVDGNATQYPPGKLVDADLEALRIREVDVRWFHLV